MRSIRCCIEANGGLDTCIGLRGKIRTTRCGNQVGKKTVRSGSDPEWGSVPPTRSDVFPPGSVLTVFLFFIPVVMVAHLQ